MKKELEYIGGNITGVSASVFLCAMGGILVWVNGGSGWYVLSTLHGRMLPLSLIFLSWLFTYALYGFRLAMRVFCKTDRCYLSVQGRVCLAYLLDLVWYAIFFCTRMSMLALVVILTSAVLNISVLLKFGKGMIISKSADAAVILCEILYMIFTVMYGLLK